MIAVILAALLQPQAAIPQPLLIVLSPQPDPWAELATSRGWLAAAPAISSVPPVWDAVIRSVEGEIAKHEGADASRVYLIAEGPAAGLAVYMASRVPHLFAAVAAAGGSAKPAIDTNRLFRANLSQVPALWVNSADDVGRERLSAARVRFQPAATGTEVIEFLASHNRAEPPAKVDCETGNPQFGRCFWIEMTRFDPSRRNDVLALSRVIPGAGAYLDLGGFGYDPAKPGPGLEVGWLPDGYKGPLKKGDRIVAVGGSPIEDARAYVRLMDQVREERPTAVTVMRGKDRVRLETRVLLPRREENVTARVQAEHLPDSAELQIISRGVTELRVHWHDKWPVAAVNWNGREAGRIAGAGCWLIAENTQAAPCPAK